MPRTATRRHAPAEERRAQILDAALQCFASRGYHAATMDDLACAAGLSKGSLYWHFRSKEEVFLAVFDRFVGEVFAVWDREAALRQPVLEAVRRSLDYFLETIASQGDLLRAWIEFLTHPAARERFARVYRESRSLLAEMLRRGVERSEVRDLPPEGMAAAFVAGTEGLLIQALVDPEFDARAHWAAVWAGLERGYAA